MINQTSGPDQVPDTENIIVLDFGKTNVKIMVVTGEGAVLCSMMRPTTANSGPPFKSIDVSELEHWIFNGIKRLAAEYHIATIVPSGHGSGAVLVDESRAILPMMDYDQPVPNEIDSSYKMLASETVKTSGPIKKGASHLGRQLYWIETGFPEDVRRAAAYLPHPQYWAWRLTGIMASDVTSLSAQSHLWDVQTRKTTALARGRGWDRLIAPVRHPWERIGSVREDLASSLGLPADTAVLCGTHDSCANLYRYQATGSSDFTLVSTGSWIVCLCDRFDTGLVDGIRPINTFADAWGNPVGGVLTMGGREFGHLTTGIDLNDVTIGLNDILDVMNSGTMALPSFERFDGVFDHSGGRGRIMGPALSTPRQRLAVACLYAALLTTTATDMLGRRKSLIVDGPFAANPMYLQLLAAFNKDSTILANPDNQGTAAGAAMLWRHDQRQQLPPPQLTRITAELIPGLEEYRGKWMVAAAAS